MILDIQGLINYSEVLVQVLELLNGGGVGDVSFNQTVAKLKCECSMIGQYISAIQYMELELLIAMFIIITIL